MILGVVVIAVLEAPVCRAYSTTYQDCTKPLRIQEFNVKKVCVEPEESKLNSKKLYKILVPQKNIKMTGYRCEIRTSRFLFFCGAFSHNKMISVPKIEVLEKLSLEGCNSLVHTNKYRVPGQSHTLHVAVGEEAVYSIDELGTIHVGKNIQCEGQQMRVGTQLVDSVIELAQFKIKISKETYILNDNRVESVGDHIKFPDSCSIGAGGCVTADGTYVWKRPDNTCPFLLAREDGEFYTEGDYLVDHNLKLRLKLTTSAQMSNNCPTGMIYYTDNPDIYLTTTNGYQKLSAPDIDIFLYVNSRADYLQWNIEKSKSQLQNFVKARVCNQQYTKTQNEIFKIDGHNALRRGDTLFLFSCTKKTGKLISSSKCYNSLMVETPTQETIFVDPITRIASKHGVETECDQQFPLTIETDAEGWVAISNVIKPVAAPQEMFVEEAKLQHESMDGTGIYTPEEEKSWEALVSYGSFRDSMVEKLTRGMCRNDEECVLEENDDMPSYNINNLLERVEEELSFKEKIDKWLQTHVGYLCAAVLLLWIFQALISIAIVVQTCIVHGMAAGLASLYSLCCFLPHTVVKVRKNAARRGKPTAPIGHNHEMQPLSGTPPEEVLRRRCEGWPADAINRNAV